MDKSIKRIKRSTGFINSLMNVVMAGSDSTGKSTLLNAAKEQFDSNVNQAIELKIASPTKTDKSAQCTVTEISTGPERLFPSAAHALQHQNSQLWQNANVVVLVISCTRRKSLENALHLYDSNVKPLKHAHEIPVIIVLTHTDAIPAGHVLSLLHHVQPVARAMPTVAIFTTPLPKSSQDVDPLFTFINRVARNPARAFVEHINLNVYHLQPSPNCVGQVLMLQQTQQSEVYSNSREQGEDWSQVVERLIQIVGVTALQEMGWTIEETSVPEDRPSSVDLSPQDLENVLSEWTESNEPKSPRWSATALSNHAASALERWTSLFDISPSPSNRETPRTSPRPSVESMDAI
jgi:hypothetical protein